MSVYLDALKRLGSVFDADVALQASMAACIELTATRYAIDPGRQWTPGHPLELLFAGYTGTRNTGADVRVAEMLRQVRHLFAEEVALTVTTIDPERSRGYFPGVDQVRLPQIFPKFVVDAVHASHGVVACEGSMFKSKFANALSTFMVGALGCAVAENKLAIGYGAEAGTMDPSLEALVRRYCRDVFVLCRNEESRAVLANLGIASESGTDTAWTFEPARPGEGDALLRAAGWDGREPVLAVCPIHPFWWPVRPDLVKGLAWRLSGAWSESHFASVYFHASGEEVDQKLEAYLDGLAAGIRAFRSRHPCFVAIVGMEALDRPACDSLQQRIGGPVFASGDHDMHAMVGLLRSSSWILSSRYHAIVCSMPARIPSAGVTMDERIRNLMADRGTPELCLTVEDPQLGPAVEAALERLASDGDALADGIGRCVVSNLERMGRMGQHFVAAVQRRHPDLPIRAGLGLEGDPWSHLPALSPALEALRSSTTD
jgi:polysaccharide pyruvyl transferase WcaK-like protein